MELSNEQMARIQKGAALLDEKSPGWYEDMDVGSLDIDDFGNCVLAKIYGSYFSGVYFLDFQGNGDQQDEEAATYGFYPTSGENPDDPDELLALTAAKTAYWKELIQKRAECDL